VRAAAPYLYATWRFGSIDFIAIVSEGEGGTLRVGQRYGKTDYNEVNAVPNYVRTEQWFASLSLLSYATLDGDAKSIVKDSLLLLLHEPFRDKDVLKFRTVVVGINGPHLI
jgi:hypothetical protein